MTEQEMVKFVKGYVKAINTHEINQIEQFHAPDSVSVSAGEPGITLDRASRRRYFEERKKAFPDAKMTARNIQVTPKSGIITFDWQIRATHKGRFQGMAPTNQPVSLRGSSEVTVKKGKITKEISRQDVASFRKLLSATTAGASK